MSLITPAITPAHGDGAKSSRARPPRSVSRPARALRTLAVFLVALAGLLAAPPDASAQTEVPADWSLIPTGLGAGDSFRLLFIPSIGTDVDLQGIERYNTFVKARAAAGHADIQAYSHTFRILASTEEVDARDNTSTTTGPGVPIYWLNGAKVADDYEDFYDGSWDEEVMGRRETGVAFTIGSRWQTWTGSAHDGTEFFDTDTTSRAVGNAGNYPVAVGRPNSSTASHGPISGSTADRTLSKGVYALSGVFTVATPPVTVELTSTTTATTTTYAIGDEVEATATFSEAVDITGTPQLELDFAGTPKPAACATGTNTTTMVCGYTVVENDSAPNGIAIAANKLTLNGGTIYATGSATTTADLTHVAVAIDAAHKVDGFRPLFVTTGNDAPTTSTDGTQVILTFSEDISSVDRTRITIVLGTDTLSTSAASAAGTTVELALTTALTATTTNLTVALSADAVEDAAGNGNLAVPAISVTNTVVATTAPTVTSVELTSTATTTTYAIGDEVEATVTFSAGVDITGTPQLELDFAGTPKPAACYLLASPNMTTMLCGYTVVMGDSAPNGIAIAANKLTLNGGMIYATGSTTTTAVLAHAAVAIDAAHKVDGIRPTLVTTGNDAPATSTDGTKVILTFSEDISSVDRTRITIMAGGNVASTSTASVAGTTVELALTTALTATTTNLTVALSADAVEDAAANGNLAVPAISVTSTVGVTTAPTVTSVDLTSTSTATTTTYAIGDEVEATVTFSEAVDITGTPQLELDFAGTPKPAACGAATNTTTMLCGYTVVMGDSAPNGIAIAANKLTGGTITATGSTTNNAVLDHAAVAIDAAHKVDGIRPTLVTTGNGAPMTSTDGAKVILTFSEDIGSVDRTNITIMSGTDTLSPSAASVAGTTVELALTTALTATTTNLTVALSADAVEDAAANGNLAVPATAVTNAVVTTTAPTVTSVELTSTATTTTITYAIGDEVEATVTFSEAVDITGTPQLELDFAGTPKAAACTAATNTTTMVCRYTVVMGDSAPNGIAIAANKLTGGTITATGSTTNTAVLAHAAVAIDAAHKIVPNAPPAFQAESTTREVAENSAAGTNVGDPVTATGDTLTYTLEGTDAASFDIVSTSGQIRTKSGVTYDYETKSSYALTVRAEDRNGGSDTIAVTITVTDVEDSPAVRAWLGRFGRTVSGQVLDAVEERLRATRAAGVSVRVAGQSIDLATKAAPEDEAEKESRSRLAAVSDWLGQETQDGKRAGMQSRTPTGPEAMMGSSFALAAKTHGGGSAVVWGRMAQSRFSGRAGGLSLDSDVTTGLLGAEYARGPLAGGAVLSNSRGKGGYGGDAAGRVAASMTALTPWAGYKVSERLSVWGALGYGAGELTLTPKAQPGQNTDLAMRLAAGGARGTVVDGDGPKLDAVADARWVRTTSEKVSSSDGHLAATSADVTRLRLGLEGSWAMTLDDQGATVTPRLSFGVRHDGGDAETGFGADIGGGVLLAIPARGLSVSLEGRGLLIHEAKGFIDTGFGASVAWDQAPSSKRGLSLTVRHSVGGSATGGKDALFSREVMDGLAANGNQRLEGRVGYGLAVYGERFTGTPELGYGLSDSGRDLSLGWRLTREGRDAGSFEASLETTRRETANDNDPEHGIGFRLTARW